MPNWRHRCSSFGFALAALVTVPSAAGAEGKETCRLAGPAQVRLAPGESSEFSIGLVPAEGYSISDTGPLRLSLSGEPASGVTVRRSEMRRKHAADPQSTAPRFPVMLEAQESGQYQVLVMARFWLCSASLCRPSRRDISIPVVVVPPATVAPVAAEPGPEVAPKAGEYSK